MRAGRFLGVAAVLVLTACGASAPEPATSGATRSEAPATPLTVAPETRAAVPVPSAGPSTTTTPTPEGYPPPIVLSGREGAYLVEQGAPPVELVDMETAFAIDDGLGGLLFQIDRDRDWDRTGEPRTTIVWWVPEGSDRPLDLLVPSEGHDLSLDDAVVVDGVLTVIYTRADGSTGSELVDSLRRFDVAAGSVTELMRMSAWEAGFEIGGVGGDVIAGTQHLELESGCFFLDLTGAPVVTPAKPSIPGSENPNCPRSCTLSRDGTRVAYREVDFDESTNTTTSMKVVVRELAGGDEVARVELPVDQPWSVADLDVAGDWLLVNRSTQEGFLPPWVIGMGGGPDAEAWEAPVAGIGRFVTAPVTVRPSPLVLRADGLGIVDFGQPMASVMPLLEARFGPPTDEWVWQSGSSTVPESCFAATGYNCDDLFRSVRWEEPRLSVVFSDGDVYRSDGTPHLTFWSSGGELATEDRATIGTTVGELRAAYGDRLVTTSVGCGDEEPALRTEGEPRIFFELSGPTDDPSTTVIHLWAGSAGSC